MTKTGVQIKNIVIGDDFRIQRTYEGLPTGVVIDTAWLTIKKKESDLDAAALIQKEITTSATSSGEITDEDTTGANLAMYFDLTDTETLTAKAGIAYLYDIQVKTAGGAIHTLERGTITFIKQITIATS